MDICYLSDIKTRNYKEKNKEYSKYEWYKKDNKENIALRLGELWHHMNVCLEEGKSFNLELMKEKSCIYNLFGSDKEFNSKAKVHEEVLWDLYNKRGVNNESFV